MITTIRTTEIRASRDDDYAPLALLGYIDTVRLESGAVQYVAYGLDYDDHTTDSPARVRLFQTGSRNTCVRKIVCRYRVWAARQG